MNKLLAPLIASVVVAGVTWGPVGTAGATFQGPAGRIAFVSTRDGNAEIYSMNPTGSDLVRLTMSPAEDSGPQWSPEGGRVAYSRDLYVRIMDADGTNDFQVPTCYYDHSPAWSPDGRRLVFVRRNGKLDQVGVTTIEGMSEVIVASSIYTGRVDWAPDGSAIAFDRDPPGTEGAIWKMAPDGSNPQPVTDKANGDSHPSWSPDSSRIAFASVRDGNSEIYAMNADGSEQVRLTHDVANDFDPVWSPDGTKIAFASDRDGNADIFVMSSDGTGPVRVTDHPGADTEPDWQAATDRPVPRPTPWREDPYDKCTELHPRTVSLTLRGHLVAFGSVSQPTATCAYDVRIQRRTEEGWRRVARAVGPEYRVDLPDRPGRYRAKVARSEFRTPYDRRMQVCLGDRSFGRVHRH